MNSVSVSEIIQSPGQEFDVQKEAIKQEINCARPGIVRAFNPATQTATIELAIRSLMGDSSVKMPLLTDVPVFFPGGASGALTFPVNPGDECLVVFSDVCIDAWFQSGNVSNPVSVRRHDLSDGFAFVGFRSRAKVLPDLENSQVITRSSSVDLMYPVGAIYFSTVDTPPSQLFGGTWEVLYTGPHFAWTRVK